MKKRNRLSSMFFLFMVATLVLTTLVGCGSSVSKTTRRSKRTKKAVSVEDEPSSDKETEASIMDEPSSDKETGIWNITEPNHDLQKNENGLYIINSAEDLVSYRTLVETEMQEDFDSNIAHANSGAILMSDIDMSSVCGENIGSWRPIGMQCVMTKDRSGLSNYPDGKLFESLLDGNGHCISHLYVDEDYSGGLFYCIKDTEVRDLTFTDCTIIATGHYMWGSPEGRGDAGTVAATMRGDSMIRNVIIENSVIVKSEDSYAGGVVGSVHTWGLYPAFERCVNHGVVSGYWGAGGIAGYSDKEVVFTDCFNDGEITEAESPTLDHLYNTDQSLIED